MVRELETRNSRPATPVARRWLALLAVGGLLAAAGGAGCNARSRPQAGGSTSSKAQAARKQAEGYAVEAVKAAAAAEVAAHPELARKGGLLAWVPWSKPATTVSTTVTPTPPPPATSPAPSAPPASAVRPAPKVEPAPAVQPPPPRAEAPIRAAARASSPAVIRERVASSLPYPTDIEAEEDALRQAQDRIEQKLREMDPPVRYRPSAEVVKNEFVRRDSRVVRPIPPGEQEVWRERGLSPDRVFVEYEVVVTADQLRELRTQDRVGDGLRVLGIVTAVSLAAFLFLRLDEWTKGYLTSWLAVAAIALGGGVAAALLFV